MVALKVFSLIAAKYKVNKVYPENGEASVRIDKKPFPLRPPRELSLLVRPAEERHLDLFSQRPNVSPWDKGLIKFSKSSSSNTL